MAPAAVGFHAARIIRKRMLSPTICWIHLQAADSLNTFSPGQWVDFVVPGLPWVGGFSLVSDPADLPVLSLAVRQSEHAPSTWVHDKSSEGGDVEIRVGGTCTLQNNYTGRDEATSMMRPVVFCAGGIGIVPMLSLYRAHYGRLQTLATSPSTPTSLLYSASTQEEMVFADELINLVKMHGQEARGDRLVLTLTQQTAWKHTRMEQQEDRARDSGNTSEGLIAYRSGRQLSKFLSEQAADSVYYLCGPPAMMDDAARILRDRGVPSTDVNYEKWW
jgi:ferredoxin-NADP reductase